MGGRQVAERPAGIASVEVAHVIYAWDSVRRFGPLLLPGDPRDCVRTRRAAAAGLCTHRGAAPLLPSFEYLAG